jgi:cysteine desulfurase/selenocysteine lyase
MEAMDDYYNNHNANVHRGIYAISEEATKLYEGAREKTRAFINARSTKEIIFTKGATGAINLVSYSLGKALKPGDQVISTVMEHHSNLVPWYFLQKAGVKVDHIDVTPEGTLDLASLERLISNKTKLVTFTGCSNVLGTITPAREIVKIVHDHGALAMVDGAQSVPHLPVDVQKIGCDLMAFSGHKMLGPTGIGVLYGREEVLEKMEPFEGGGDMIREVQLNEATYNDLPYRFEAGTPNIAGAIGLGAAVDYLTDLGMENVRRHEKELVSYALKHLGELPGMKIYGPTNPEIKGGVVAFNFGRIHGHDLATIMDKQGICLRSGHHCAQPLLAKYDTFSTSRASFYVYNDESDVDALVAGFEKAKQIMRA